MDVLPSISPEISLFDIISCKSNVNVNLPVIFQAQGQESCIYGKLPLNLFTSQFNYSGSFKYVLVLTKCSSAFLNAIWFQLISITQ